MIKVPPFSRCERELRSKNSYFVKRAISRIARHHANHPRACDALWSAHLARHQDATLALARIGDLRLLDAVACEWLATDPNSREYDFGPFDYPRLLDAFSVHAIPVLLQGLLGPQRGVAAAHLRNLGPRAEPAHLELVRMATSGPIRVRLEVASLLWIFPGHEDLMGAALLDAWTSTLPAATPAAPVRALADQFARWLFAKRTHTHIEKGDSVATPHIAAEEDGGKDLARQIWARLAIASWLGSSGPVPDVPAVLDSADDEIRVAGENALREELRLLTDHGRRLTETRWLFAAFEGASTRVRRSLLHIVLQHEYKDACVVAWLRMVAGDADELARRTAQIALAEAGAYGFPGHGEAAAPFRSLPINPDTLAKGLCSEDAETRLGSIRAVCVSSTESTEVARLSWRVYVEDSSPLIRDYLDNDDNRNCMLGYLRGSGRVLQEVMSTLESPLPEQRARAELGIAGFCKEWHFEGVDELEGLRRACRHPNVSVRLRAIECLKSAGVNTKPATDAVRDAVVALLRDATRDTEKSVRLQAWRALPLDDAYHPFRLPRELPRGEGVTEGWQVVDWLFDVSVSGPVCPDMIAIVGALARSKDQETRIAATCALLNIRPNADTNGHLATFARAMRSTDWMVVRTAATALGLLPVSLQARVAPLLLEGLETWSWKILDACAASLLKSSADRERVVEGLITALRDPVNDVRAHAAAWLGQCATATGPALAALRTVASADEYFGARENAIDAIEAIEKRATCAGP